MNKKAESFQAYLKEKNLSAFTVDEIKDDPFQIGRASCRERV